MMSSPSAAKPFTQGWRYAVTWPLVILVRFYQRFISPLFPPTCRFYPSCSAYALTALQRYGPVKGTWLAIRRLVRCHPWNPGGVDHVPPREGSASANPRPHHDKG